MGSFGLAATFSFYANKTMTTGEGGIVVTNDADLHKVVVLVAVVVVGLSVGLVVALVVLIY